MKRIISLLIIAVLLLGIFAGCQTVPDDATDGTTTVPETTEPIPSSDPEETTVPTSGSDLDEETIIDTAFAPEIREIRYVWPPEGYAVFLFDGEVSPFVSYADQINTVGLTEGLLYVYREVENICAPVCSEQVDAFVATEDYIYYITRSSPDTIFRTGYSGDLPVVVYRSDSGSIRSLRYHGKDKQGKLLFCQGNNKVILANATTGAAELLTEQEGVLFCWHKFYPEHGGFVFRWALDDGSIWTLKENRTEEEVPVKMISSRKDYYAEPPDGFFVFNHDGYSYTRYQKLDTSVLTEGMIYVYREPQNKLFPIGMSAVRCHYTKDHVYYVPADAPNKVVRSDYAGQKQEVVYESQYGDIINFSFSGTDPGGKLYLCEAERYAVEHDLADGSTRAVLEKENMQSWSYAYGNSHYPPEYEGRWFAHIKCKDFEWWIIDPDTGELVRHIVEGP